MLSSIFLHERLDFTAKIGCAQCLIGATIVVLNAPESNSTSTVQSFFSHVFTGGFLVYSSIVWIGILYLINNVAPIHGTKHPLVYISICSLVGSFLVVVAQGFGSAIVYSASHWDNDNQFREFGFYILLLLVVITVIMQVNYLNKAINTFSTAIVTPIYYVFFTTASIVTSAVLYRGYNVNSPIQIVNIVFAFLVIIGGVVLLFEYHIRQGTIAELKNDREMGILSHCESKRSSKFSVREKSEESNILLQELNETNRDPLPTSWCQEIPVHADPSRLSVSQRGKPVIIQ